MGENDLGDGSYSAVPLLRSEVGEEKPVIPPMKGNEASGPFYDAH